MKEVTIRELIDTYELEAVDCRQHDEGDPILNLKIDLTDVLNEAVGKALVGLAEEIKPWAIFPGALRPDDGRIFVGGKGGGAITDPTTLYFIFPHDETLTSQTVWTVSLSKALADTFHGYEEDGFDDEQIGRMRLFASRLRELADQVEELANESCDEES